MGKHTSTAASTSASAPTPTVAWPKLTRCSPKPHEVLAEQLVLFPAALTPHDCQRLVSLFSPPSPHTLLPSPQARKGEAQRTNHRFAIDDPNFAQQLYVQSGLQSAVQGWKEEDGRVPVALSSNIRVYRYDASQFFHPHYDDSVRDAATGHRTEWTVLFYLTGIEDGVVDGQTVFYRNHSTRTHKPKPNNRKDMSKKSTVAGEAKGEGMEEGEGPIVVPLHRGTALLHRHGKACMLHEARPPHKSSTAAKWVLRSDLVFAHP
ncbi:hypothetical protein ACQY0O_006673 [Thecaphora frezii]